MSKKDSQKPNAPAANPSEILDYAGGRAALAEANRHTDILFTSLAGVACIVIVLLVALALPVFGANPITSIKIFIIMVLTALAGIGELCIINMRAHRHVTVQALLTEVLLNSLGQGYLSFDAKGVCGQVYSQACLDLLESMPAGKNIAEVLRLGGEQKNDFMDWLEMLFAPDHALSFDDVAKFLPQNYRHSINARHVGLFYRPVHDKSGKLLSVVMIATDQTEEAEAQRRARMQQNFVTMISTIFKERGQFMVTLTHLRKFIAESKIPIKQDDGASILRLLHTLKAASKHFHLDALGGVIHKLEADLRSSSIISNQDFQERLWRGGDEIEICLRSILEQVGELIGQDFEGRGNLREISEETIYGFARSLREQKADPELIRQFLLAIAAIPINESFKQFEREIKDLAEIMGKKVKPVLYTGTNPRVLMQPLEGFLLAIMHISRNIIDHGIEPAVTRLARGKEPAGLVTVHTALVDDPEKKRKMLQILISDDGNGIDPALVREKLAKIDPEGLWRFDDDVTVIQRIMQWEVSTRTEVTDLSGRGVGMEAVDREVRLLGGTIRVCSELYKGTKFDIRLPYLLDVPGNF